MYDHGGSTGGNRTVIGEGGGGGGGGGEGLARRSLPGTSPRRRNYPATDFPKGTGRQDWQIVQPRIPAELVLNFLHAYEDQQNLENVVF